MGPVGRCLARRFCHAQRSHAALLFLSRRSRLALVVAGYIFSLIVMGGAARNLVMHLLWNEPVSMRATYDAVRSRFWGLLGATIIMVVWVGVSVMVAGFGWYTVVIIVTVGAVVFAQIAPAWVSVVVWINRLGCRNSSRLLAVLLFRRARCLCPSGNAG